MTLERRGAEYFGESAADTRAYLREYGAHRYVVEHFAEPKCACGGIVFRLQLDDNVGVAVRTCTSCAATHAVGDSAEYLAEAELDECECPCGSDHFELTVGTALYQESSAVRWVYVGARCPRCSRVGCYGDWKNEQDDYRAYLSAA